MALWTKTDVRAIAAEMSVANGVADATVDLYISIADLQIDPRVFGDSTIQAGAYLTAHLLKVDGYGAPGQGAGGGAAGPVTGITVGRVSVQYADATSKTGSGVSADLARTRYGITYARFVRLALPSPMVI